MRVFGKKRDRMLKKVQRIIGLCLFVFFIQYPFVAVGGTLTHTYDNLNRLTKVVYGDGTAEAFTYDAAGNRFGPRQRLNVEIILGGEHVCFKFP